MPLGAVRGDVLALALLAAILSSPALCPAPRVARVDPMLALRQE
jgi:ABC-type lipoprotein release transport system permease subunit